MLILFIIDTIKMKKTKVDSYTIEIIILSMIQSIFTFNYGFVITVVITLLTIAIECLIRRIFKKDKKILEKLSIGYYLSVINIITIIIINSLACRC